MSYLSKRIVHPVSDALRAAIGREVAAIAVPIVIEDVDHLKAWIEGGVRAFLVAKLGRPFGDLAANEADLACNALANTIDAAIRSLATER